MKNIVIAGASGMIGSLILDHCLADLNISRITSLVRRKTAQQHPKLNEVVIKDFTDYSNDIDLFKSTDIAFFCIGVYTGQVPDDMFKRITVDYAVSFAEAVKKSNPKATLCLLSGAGADRTEKSRASFARYKGMAENQIAEMGLTFYTFRPGYIYPVTPRKEPNIMYRIMRFCYPLFKLAGNNSSIKSTDLASALFNIGMNGAQKEILENRDIMEYIL